MFPGELSRERQTAIEVATNHFIFLGRKVDLPDRIDWHTPAVSQLWRYHLHYFGYSRSLLLAAQIGGGDIAYDTFRRLVRSWIRGNEKLRGDGWHPYTLSLRLANWLQVAAAWAPRLAVDPDFRDLLFRSAFAQARMLRRQLELDVRGNHLLENLRGLLWASLAFEGPEPREWRECALKLLEEETTEQVLGDGGHFERTPGYHGTVLKDYLEIALLLERNTDGCPAWVREAVRRLAFFLREILGPRQRIPLVKDTAYDAAPNPDELLNAAAGWLNEPRLKPAAAPGLETFLLLGDAGWKKVSGWPEAPPSIGATALRASGFYMLRGRDGEHAIIDAGKPCPDYLPAHAHADIFSFEYHVRGVPVIVDSGVYEYKAGPWRDFFRSTRAHNTVEIAGQNSSEVWASFRVGRRARPHVKVWQPAPGRAELLAAHDGYRYLKGKPVHERAMLWREGEYLIIIDRVTGTGILPITSHLHFHPTLEPREEMPGCWNIEVAGSPLWLHRLGELDLPAPVTTQPVVGQRACARSEDSPVVVSGGMADDTFAQAQGHESHDLCPSEVQPVLQLGPTGYSMVRGRELPAPQGWYSERFGAKQANHVLSFHYRASLPHVSGYAFSSYPDFSCTTEQEGLAVRLRVTFAGGVCVYRISESTVECLP
jgi:uncharacterized heparinase superfamily protein